MLLAVCPNPSVDYSIWIDSLEPGKVHRATREERYPGGKGVHVAMAAAELGEDVTLLQLDKFLSKNKLRLKDAKGLALAVKEVSLTQVKIDLVGSKLGQRLVLGRWIEQKL